MSIEVDDIETAKAGIPIEYGPKVSRGECVDFMSEIRSES